MATFRMVIDATLDVDGDDVASACAAAAAWFQAVADQSGDGTSLFDVGASTSVAPVGDDGWGRYAAGVWDGP